MLANPGCAIAKQQMAVESNRPQSHNAILGGKSSTQGNWCVKKPKPKQHEDTLKGKISLNWFVKI